MPKKTKDGAFLVLEKFQERPISYYRFLSLLTWSVKGWVLLSQVMYWDNAMGHQEFHKTDAEFAQEVGMGLKEFRAAKLKIQEYVHISVRWVPAKTYYHLDRESLVQAITSICPKEANKNAKKRKSSLPKRGNLVCPKEANKNTWNGQTITENTTETTTENTTEILSKESSGKPLKFGDEKINEVILVIKTTIEAHWWGYKAGRNERNLAKILAYLKGDWGEYLRSKNISDHLMAIKHITEFSLKNRYTKRILCAEDFFYNWAHVIDAMRRNSQESQETHPNAI